ncbi:MAG: YmdB family metallophosphoesterase [Pirellulaceae bacterium]|jgi:metallophosphoesterase (TIGR00282 family)
MLPLDERNLRVALLGDIVGVPGMQIACQAIPWLKQTAHCHLVVANAENAADGTGLRVAQYKKLIAAGADAITMGDHIYRKRELIPLLQQATNIVKPANFPPEAPGLTWCQVPTPFGHPLIVFSLLGRLYMRPVDCPLHAAKGILNEVASISPLRLIDCHAEATSEKQSIARFLDGSVSAVLGTHTHVPTADLQILPKGTGFQCDVGMTGAYESILGRSIERVLAASFSFDPSTLEIATEDLRCSTTLVDLDPQSGRCLQIQRLELSTATLQSQPS